jgi:hypothetical protein
LAVLLMGDMAMPEVDEATAQIWQAFQGMAPMLDATLKLSQQAPPKRQRKGEHKQGAPPKPKGQPDQQQLTQAMMLLAKLAIKMDRELQMMKKEDTFIFFFVNKGKEGCLQELVQATDQWVNQLQEHRQSQPLTPMMPLRQHLMQVLFNTLLTRVQKLGEAQDGSEVVKAAQHNLVLLADRSCPFLDWDRNKKELVVSKKQPLSLKRIHQICTDLLEALTDHQLVVKFHALPEGQNQTVSPWRLQVSMRQDGPWQLLNSLCHSAIWLLVGTSLKSHSLLQSPLAHQLQQTLNLPSNNTKGKGKGKQQPQLEAKQE